ncbi:hypothetical protein [Glycomyces algeriensis]|uniref:Uncharacterized protein n=1 Tax=Glycomyces algeriensis TaxID=256037 RepID=A0A9W6GE18_9ACTN|nr:hypothetical protein [Glycomyces algeriensis]MDA1366626.1 hypothetical protein [Glycomyces algeriensis]MDR7352283.1 hypothetical protein [Glycomyces algeriensis]GLI45018.1 hypothetical protein GALLR39Z86_48680 [Glycomyces algeriensis]
MNLQDDPGAVFRTVMPEAPPPPRQLDLDQVVRDGYRARRRHQMVLGGAATTGVAAVAAVLALTVVGLPGSSADPADDPASNSAAAPPAEEEAVDDPAMSGYPYAEEDQFDSEAEQNALHEGAMAGFKPLLDQVGVVLTDDVPLEFNTRQSPGNYGQTWLRSYITGASNDEGDGGEEDVVLRVKALLPGGWTAEPGPVTEQLFPQHVISASGSPWQENADWTDELKTSDLGDGRTLTTVDHGCAYEALITYPNGSGLHASWDMGCGEGTSEYEISLEELTTAMTAMPEVDYDTSELSPVGELLEVPTGWLYDPEWEEAAQEPAEASISAADDVLSEILPGASLDGAFGSFIGMVDRGTVVNRSYYSTGTLPFTTTIDSSVDDIGIQFSYTLPGGWLPGITEGRGPELARCQPSSTCETTTDEDGTIWAFESAEALHEPTEEEIAAGMDFEPFTEHILEVTRFHPDGWAVSIWTQWQDESEVNADLIADLLAAMPAPQYDASATPVIPAE